jgi:hypothetical protein
VNQHPPVHPRLDAHYDSFLHESQLELISSFTLVTRCSIRSKSRIYVLRWEIRGLIGKEVVYT